MGVEIERKFLVNAEKLNNIINKADIGSLYIRQGYILNSKEKVVRVRVADNNGYITIKGSNVGMTRPEFEYEINVAEAEQMLDTMCDSYIDKIRHLIKINDDTWEVDVFMGDNRGLIVAELEVPTEDYKFDIPDWIELEVTDDAKYYNNNLLKKPYKEWK